MILLLALACKPAPESELPDSTAVDTAPADADADGVAAPADCDDTNPAVHPGADEVCNGVDDDCNSWIDDNPADATTWYNDADGDGFGDAVESAVACDGPMGSVAIADDCDDTDSTVHPGADERCDLVDSDCDGVDGGECAPELTGENDASSAAATLYGESVGDGAGRHNGRSDVDGDGTPEVWTYSIRKDDEGGNQYSAIDFFALPAAGTLVAGTDSIAQRSGPVGEQVSGTGADCDLDGDGVDDLVLVDVAVYLELGPIGGVGAWTETADATVAADQYYPNDVSCSGDLTGDSVDDVVVLSQSLPPDTYAGGGGVLILSWPLDPATDANNVERSLYWPSVDMGAGSHGVALNDADGDGIAEVIVGQAETWGYTSTMAWFEHGPINTRQHLQDSDTTFAADPERTHWIGELYDVEDLDGDGLGDVGIQLNNGDLETSPFNGLWIHHDPPAGSVDTTTGWAHFYSRTSESAVVNPAVGDIDGDGAPDIMFRSYPDNCPDSDDSALYIAYGPFSGSIEAESLPDRICGGAGVDGFGYESAFLGDADDDGFEDFIVGTATDWRVSPGVAFIFRGSPRGR